MISRSVILRLRSVSGKICGENQNILSSATLFLSENRAIYEITWKNAVELEGPQTTI